MSTAGGGPAPDLRDARRVWLAVVLVGLVVGLIAGLSVAVRGGLPATSSAAGPVTGAPPAAPGAVGSSLVSVADPAASAFVTGAVVDLLDRHFTAINDGDYPTWRTTVTAQRGADQSRARWERSFASTMDSDVVVSGVVGSATGYDVTLSFVSVQDVADAPSDLPVARICWTSVWPVVEEAAGLRIGTPESGSTKRTAC